MTPSQLTTLKAAILAETDAEFVGYRTNGQTTLMAEWFNRAHPSQKAWAANAQWADVANAIDFLKYTPSPANTPTDTAGTNRMLAVLIKLQVQQNMLLALASGVDARDSGNVLSLLDTVTAVPSGAAGAGTAPGGASGVNVAHALTRPATRAEALFVSSSPAFGTVTAALLSFEGAISDYDISAALAA